MKVTYEIRRALVDGAKADLDKANKALSDAETARINARTIYEWASKLSIGSELTSAPSISVLRNAREVTSRYFVPSKSGMTKGHYIVYDNVTGYIDCTCPGFVNRGHCWATNSLKAGTLASAYLWRQSNSVFESNRRLAR